MEKEFARTLNDIIADLDLFELHSISFIRIDEGRFTVDIVVDRQEQASRICEALGMPPITIRVHDGHRWAISTASLDGFHVMVSTRHEKLDLTDDERARLVFSRSP